MTHFISNLFEAKSNGPEIATLLAALLKVKISATSLRKDIEEHPDYPSLLGISDVLNSYGIANLAIKTPADGLMDLPVPFITQISGIKSKYVKYFTIVKRVSDTQLEFFDPENHKWLTVQREDFISRFSGIVLLAEAQEVAGEKEYEKNVKLEGRARITRYFLSLIFPALLSAAGLIALMQYGSSALLPLLFSVFTMVGLGISILLVLYEVDRHNPALQQICSSGKKVNCEAVLQSKGAKFFGISWSTIGLSYFAGILLLMLIGGGLTNPVSLFSIAWINILAMPYVVFSVYYQWRVAKQWCVLCLGVQGVLILQFATSFFGGWYSIMRLETLLDLAFYLPVFTSLALPFICISIILPALNSAKKAKQINNKLQRLKHDRQVFKALLYKQKELTEHPLGLGITLGNPNASSKLIKVCSPYCGPCAKAHQPMEELLQNNPDVQVQILFNATNDEADVRTPVVKHFMAIASTENETFTKSALDSWYAAENKDYEKFASQYSFNGELGQQGPKIDAMKAWCDTVKIEFTPTFFVAAGDDESGETKYYQLPEIYNVNDLKYFFSV